jgi:hypothetical protein
MRWGTGEAAALRRVETVTREELQSMGMTEELALQWAAFYRAVTLANPANDSARGRAVLMEYAAELLRGAQ